MQSRSLTAAILLCATLLPAQNPDRPNGGRQRREPPPPPAALVNFTHQESKFQSEAVGKDMAYGIYLPKGYDDEANKVKKAKKKKVRFHAGFSLF